MTASEPQARIAREIEQIRSKQAQIQTPRFAEVLFAASTLILVAPIMVLAAIAIKSRFSRTSFFPARTHGTRRSYFPNHQISHHDRLRRRRKRCPGEARR